MVDKTLRVLSDPLRRRVLRTVAEHDEPIELETLGTKTIMEAEKWEAHQIALYHIHLPKLEDHGLIQWNREGQTVEEGERFGVARSLLDSLGPGPDDSDRFSPTLGIMLASALV